jgi:hypothetical protein
MLLFVFVLQRKRRKRQLRKRRKRQPRKRIRRPPR